MTTSRPEVIAMLREIKSHPDNDELRLILADWLEERGDPRGTYLRLQCELENLTEEDEAYQRLQEEKIRLSEEHVESWTKPLTDLNASGSFKQGLLSMSIFAVDLLYRPGWKEVLKSETWAWVTELIIGDLLPQYVEDLLAAPYLDGITSLEVRDSDIGSRITDLLTSSRLKGLQRLLVSTELEDKAVIAMAQSPHLANLRELDLCENYYLTGASLQALAKSPLLGQLEWLYLDHNPLGSEAMASLSTSPGPKNLQSLSLVDAQIESAGAEVLAASPSLRNLKYLNLSENTIEDPGVQAIAASPVLSLRALVLNGCNVDDEGPIAIAGSANSRSLRHLDLSYNFIDDAGAIALADSPHLLELQSLDLRSNNLGVEGKQVLKARFGNRVELDPYQLA